MRDFLLFLIRSDLVSQPHWARFLINSFHISPLSTQMWRSLIFLRSEITYSQKVFSICSTLYSGRLCLCAEIRSGQTGCKAACSQRAEAKISFKKVHLNIWFVIRMCQRVSDGNFNLNNVCLTLFIYFYRLCITTDTQRTTWQQRWWSEFLRSDLTDDMCFMFWWPLKWVKMPAVMVCVRRRQ